MSVTAWPGKQWIGFVFCLSLVGGQAVAQSFSDMFADRQLLTGDTAIVTGSNSNATLEPGEPRIAGKTGGHSVWISWLAPGDGLATMTTDGSSFDTLLGVYVLERDDGPVLAQLQPVGDDDDHNLLLTSSVQFGTRSNRVYQIAVDGFNGATGNIVLSLSFVGSGSLLPQVLTLPGDQSLRLGDPLILTVKLVPTRDMDINWYLNGNPVNSDDDDSGPTLVIRSLQSTNLGLYTVRLGVEDRSFFSAPVEIQVNSEGQRQTLARNKLADAAQSGLRTVGGLQRVNSVPGNPSLPAPTPLDLSGGLIVGYNGTQIFNTTFATVDPTEPPICGVQGGASYWFAYQAPAAGTMTIDTGGSTFDTLLGVFTYNGTLYDYTNLISVACDNNSGSNGLTSWVQFLTEKGRNYFVVVDGVAGSRGVAHLNYSLSAGQPVLAPFVTVPPKPMVVTAQTPVILSVVANGTAPFSYQWWRDAAALHGRTNASLLLASPRAQDSGNYTVVVTNSSGSITCSPAQVTVISVPSATFNPTSSSMISAFPAVRGYQYAVDCAAILAPGAWQTWTNLFPDDGGVIWLTNSTQASNAQFIRVHSP